MDTNLYDFLRDIQKQANGAYGDAVISEAQWNWLESFLRNPGVVIEFHARPTGKMVQTAEGVEEVMEQHYQLAGKAEEVFQLLCEAMLLNPTWASLVVAAGRYYTTHVPLCRKCSQRHNGRLAEDCPDVQDPKWEFKPRQQ